MKTQLSILLAATTLSIGGSAALAQDSDVKVPPTANAPAVVLDPAATAIVHKCADFYAGMKGLSATLNGKVHVEAEGQREDNNVAFDVKMQRPNQVSLVGISGKMTGLAKCDGNKLHVFSPAMGSSGMYETLSAPSTLSEAFSKPDIALASGGMSGLSLLEAFVAKDPYDTLMNGVTSVALVGKEDVEGHATKHLHFRQSDISWDLWIDDGNEPWVRKVVPDITNILAKYKEKTPGDIKMNMTITYSNMKENPVLVATDFQFTPPSGAKEVPSFFGLNPNQAKDQILRRPAPPINLATLDGGKFDLASFKGKNIIVLGFWTTWAPPCVESLTTASELAQEYAGKGVKFYAIDVKEDKNKIKEFIATNKLNVNVLLDSEGDAAAAFGVSGIPQTIIIDTDGIVRAVQLGLEDNVKEKLADEVDIILAGQPSAN